MSCCLNLKNGMNAWGTFPGREFQVGQGKELEQSILVLVGEKVSNARAASQKFPHQGSHPESQDFCFFICWLV
jgi:hypothetical protein